MVTCYVTVSGEVINCLLSWCQHFNDVIIHLMTSLSTCQFDAAYWWRLCPLSEVISISSRWWRLCSNIEILFHFMTSLAFDDVVKHSWEAMPSLVVFAYLQPPRIIFHCELLKLQYRTPELLLKIDKMTYLLCSERTGNCTVAAIPAWLGDAAKSEGRPTRLKLASELLQVETGSNNTQSAGPPMLKLASELLQVETSFNNTQRAGQLASSWQANYSR